MTKEEFAELKEGDNLLYWQKTQWREKPVTFVKFLDEDYHFAVIRYVKDKRRERVACDFLFRESELPTQIENQIKRCEEIIALDNGYIERSKKRIDKCQRGIEELKQRLEEYS